MNKLVIALEGVDGGGKSSLARHLGKLCGSRAIAFQSIGRRPGDSSPPVSQITDLVQQHAGTFVHEADMFLRLAREFQRADEAARVDNGVVVLDRFVLSVLSRARAVGRDVPLFTELLSRSATQAGLFATIYVDCPFQIAWKRLTADADAGRRQLSAKEKRGEEFNRRLCDYMREDFEQGALTGHKWLVNNAGSLKEAEAQLQKLLEPHLDMLLPGHS